MYEELQDLKRRFEEIVSRNCVNLGWGASGELKNLIDSAFFTGLGIGWKEGRGESK